MKACKTLLNLIVNLLKFITYKIMYTKLQLQQALLCIIQFYSQYFGVPDWFN